MTFDDMLEGGSDEFVLSTGTRFYANNGILGIAAEDGQVVAYEGYDGMGPSRDRLTKEERREIADHAIALWNRWAE